MNLNINDEVKLKNGDEIMVVEDNNCHCEGCYFFGGRNVCKMTEEEKSGIFGECGKRYRKDKRDIIFVEVERNRNGDALYVVPLVKTCTMAVMAKSSEEAIKRALDECDYLKGFMSVDAELDGPVTPGDIDDWDLDDIVDYNRNNKR